MLQANSGQNTLFTLEESETILSWEGKASIQTWKKTFFVNSKKFGNAHLAGKKHVNYDKFEIATNCVNQKLKLNAFFFFLLTGAT